ncbi:exopolyphosphatase, partial [Neisseria sp. P0012.S006]
RGDLKNMADIIGNHEILWCAVLSLRLAALYCRSRLPIDLPPQTQLRVDEYNHSFIFLIYAQWLEQHPLIADALDYE